jgi:hypothetical protein
MGVPEDLVENGEVFLPVEGTLENYFVSNKGRVYVVSMRRFATILDNGAGYKNCCIYIKGRRGLNSCRYIHRLVAEHFIPNPDNKKFVNHIDHDKSNNCVENLDWVTAKENTAHGIINGRINAKKRGRTNQLTDTQRCRSVVMRKTGYGVNEIAQSFNLPRTTISSVFNGRSNAELVDFMQELCEDVTVGQLDVSLRFNKIKNSSQEDVDTTE